MLTSNPDVTVTPAPGDRDTIMQMMQLYVHDMSAFTAFELEADGRFQIGERFGQYWVEDNRHPFLIRADGELAGFALVREVTPGLWSMDEFFVLRGHRRRGVGEAAAAALFDRFRGQWHVAQMETNEPAQNFWRAIIDRYTEGGFREGWSKDSPRGPMQMFES